VLVVLRSSGTGVMIWHRLGTQICMRLARINIVELTKVHLRFAIAANVSATSMFADLPSIVPLADGRLEKARHGTIFYSRHHNLPKDQTTRYRNVHAGDLAVNCRRERPVARRSNEV